MRYRYLDDFRRGISVFAIFSYGIAVLGTPNVPLRTVYVNNNTQEPIKLWIGRGGSELESTIFAWVEQRKILLKINQDKWLDGDISTKNIHLALLPRLF